MPKTPNKPNIYWCASNDFVFSLTRSSFFDFVNDAAKMGCQTLYMIVSSEAADLIERCTPDMVFPISVVIVVGSFDDLANRLGI